MNTQEKYNLITRNLKEIVDPDNIMTKILEKRNLNIYWGTAPTGKIHVGYFIPLMKIADFVSADCNVKILIADLHATLDNMKSNFKQVVSRKLYYKNMLCEMLKVLNVNLDKIEFVYGSDFQLKSDYVMDMFKILSLTTYKKAKHSGAQVVKQSDNPFLSSLVYPQLQMLDEHYMNVDIQFGGIDQRKIFMEAREMLPKIGYKKKIHLMTPIVGGMRTCAQVINQGEIDDKINPSDEIDNKMSSSNENSKIDILDSRKVVNKKINKIWSIEGDTEDNSLLELSKNILFPMIHFFDKEMKIERSADNGGDINIANYDDLEILYSQKNIHPADLKRCMANFFVDLLKPIREYFMTREMVKLLKESY